jgi:S-layer family protein
MRNPIVSRLIVLSAAALLVGSSIGSAQTFGTSSQELIIPAQNWTPAGGGYQFNGNGSITPTVDGAQTWITSLGVPAGAQIASIDFLITDNDASMDIAMTLSVSTFPLGLTGSCGGNFASTTSIGVSGLGIVTMTAPLGTSPVTYHSSCNSMETLNNIYLSVTLQTTQHTLWGARVTWNRSVSPAPELGSFGDVPSSDFGFQYIEALNASGITGGCGNGNYCPDSPVTRRQMAIFIAKSLGLYFPK